MRGMLQIYSRNVNTSVCSLKTVNRLFQTKVKRKREYCQLVTQLANDYFTWKKKKFSQSSRTVRKAFSHEDNGKVGL